jgi:hypothetical protein
MARESHRSSAELHSGQSQPLGHQGLWSPRPHLQQRLHAPNHPDIGIALHLPQHRFQCLGGQISQRRGSMTNTRPPTAKNRLRLVA